MQSLNPENRYFNSTTSILLASHRLETLHHQRKVFELKLQNRQGTTSHFHAAGGIARSLRRHPESPPHQKYLQQLSGFTGVDQPTLKKVIPQSR
jgi:hypothetical protein